jgi:hypothetical protein
MALGGLKREQLIELVRRIIEFDGTEEEVDSMEALFESSVLYPGIYSLIYQSDPELGPEEVVEKALSYEAVAPPYDPGSGSSPRQEEQSFIHSDRIFINAGDPIRVNDMKWV